MAYIMALDAGTTSNRCILFDQNGTIVSLAQKEFRQYYPKPGWVEQDAVEIWDTMRAVITEAMTKAGVSASEIAGIGITNQRETTVVWNKKTGEPLCRAIVWQCRRTADRAEGLKRDGHTEMIRKKTGLVVDAYFSATKFAWILREIPEAKALADEGALAFGTIDTWLIWNLSGGTLHVTDYSNASRTMMFNIHDLCWDDEILSLLHLPKNALPKACPSSCVYGMTDPLLLGVPVPIAGAAGDQQCALFGQTCFERGDVKNTYGTGGFLLMNTGDAPAESSNGLLTSIAWGVNGEIRYCLEGSIFIAGATIQWLRDELGILENAAMCEEMANRVEDTNGCYIVPAFTGLGAPYWNPNARGMITGLTRGCNRDHLVRAALDSMAYQVNDVIRTMRSDTGGAITSLFVDGGAAANSYLCQRQADLSDLPVLRPKSVETTALGAAYLAGLAVSFFDGMDSLKGLNPIDRTFMPAVDADARSKDLAGWRRAVRCAVAWTEEA